MKATSGAHFVALDHIRAVAAILVFVWHFAHGGNGTPVPFEGAPFWGPLVLFDEGHVGVALFMTLSGYLFAKLLNGRDVIYSRFLWNRVLRLFPLLILVTLLYSIVRAVDANDVRVAYWVLVVFPKGFIIPAWPNGGWSITAELHFYLLLPALLALRRKALPLLLLVVAAALAFRVFYYVKYGEVQSIAYWTILGRIDQFVFGIIAFHSSGLFKQRHVLVAVVAVVFISVYYWFDLSGGWTATSANRSVWIWLPTIEGAAFAAFIAWYDTSFEHRPGPWSNGMSRIGEYSYSIYLLHFFFVFEAAHFIHKNVLDISSFYVAVPAALIVFAGMIPLGYLSMRYVETPFLRLRKAYIKAPANV